MAILVQLLSLCYKLLKKVENSRWVSVTSKDSMDGKTWENFGVGQVSGTSCGKADIFRKQTIFVFSETQQFYKEDKSGILLYFLIMKPIVKLFHI